MSVAAVNGNGEGPAGQDHAIPYDVPDAPYNVKVAAGEVHWTAPSGRGSGVTRYRVRYRSPPDTTWSTWFETAADSGRYDYSERKASIGAVASTDIAQVEARNAAGWSATGSSTQMQGVQGGAGQTQTEPGRFALPALHASFFNLPAEHGGPTVNAVFRVRFTVPVPATPAELGAAFEVTGGKVKSVKRHSGRSDLFEVRLAPAGFEAMTVRLPVRACGTEGAICTGYGQALSQAVEATIEGPSVPALSVADARAKEGGKAGLRFAVTLDRAGSAPVTVDWATADGTATAGEDYVAASGTLTFAPGVTKRTVRIALLDDAIDEGKETMKLRLSNPQGARIADGRATGTIRNSDPLQRMWLSRFGRTVGSQIVDAVSERLSGLAPGAHATLAGQGVDLTKTDDGQALAETMTGLARAFGAEEAPAADDDPFARHGVGGMWDAPAAATARSMTGRELLLGTSFHLASRGEGSGPGLAAWGRVAHGSFDGEAPADSGSLRISGGEVMTGVLGADAEWNRLLAGVAVSLSDGEGSFDNPGVDKGSVESTMTTVSPYLRFKVTERVSAWGLAGWGTGDMTMVQDARPATAESPAREEKVTRTDLSMQLGALGARGALFEPDGAEGFDLALKADAFFVRTESEKAANSAATTADASRLRLVLEGGRRFAMGDGASFRPSLELGVRHDGGDAETGTGVEVGGGVSYADAASGLSIEAKARMLVAHADDDYEEWGASANVRLDPGERGRGLSFSLSPTIGASSSAAERLWGAHDARGLAPGGGEFEAARGLTAEAGYGLSLGGDRFTGTPNVGFGMSDGGARDYRIGWRLTSVVRGDPGFEVSLDAVRREAANDDNAEHGVMLRSLIRW